MLAEGRDQARSCNVPHQVVGRGRHGHSRTARQSETARAPGANRRNDRIGKGTGADHPVTAASVQHAPLLRVRTRAVPPATSRRNTPRGSRYAASCRARRKRRHAVRPGMSVSKERLPAGEAFPRSAPRLCASAQLTPLAGRACRRSLAIAGSPHRDPASTDRRGARADHPDRIGTAAVATRLTLLALSAAWLGQSLAFKSRRR